MPWTWFGVRDAFGVATDVLAIVLPVVAVLVLVGALLVTYWWRRALVLAVSTLLAGTVAVVAPWLPADAGAVAGPGVTVAGANVARQAQPGGALRMLSADVLVVPELSEGVVARLVGSYPHRNLQWEDAPKVGVFSRYPLRLLEATGPDFPGERVEVAGPAGPFVLYALHVPRPWFRGNVGTGYQVTGAEHHRLIEQVAARVRTETLPVVLVGDLNTPDRSRDYRVLLDGGRLVDAMLDTVGAPTSTGQWTPLLLRIDHVLVSAGWCGDSARRVELPGSDHLGVTARVGPCAAP